MQKFALKMRAKLGNVFEKVMKVNFKPEMRATLLRSLGILGKKLPKNHRQKNEKLLIIFQNLQQKNKKIRQKSKLLLIGTVVTRPNFSPKSSFVAYRDCCL